MRLVNKHLNIPKARLVHPKDSGYVLLAAEVDRRPVFFPNSRKKEKLIESVKAITSELKGLDGVLNAAVFDARLIAPGEGRRLLRARAARIHRARYDLVVLIETTTPNTAKDLRQQATYHRLSDTIADAARYVHEIAASNVRRIANVDHNRQAVFLFNYFYADDPELLVPVFEYTAGWFMAKTRLADSTVLKPLNGERGDYGIINHASWPRFRTFLPHLILRPSFRRYVLENFKANNIAAQPILYRLV